ncbi:MAG: hypothetical protein Ct9H300mP20_08610 [Gammaproteobacteria bacterium]|nr:MAG: hypothetical protein Ct9H300mP20_08610 [Gammaproteobacteria bacterium]
MKASDFKNLGIKPFNKGLSDLGNNIYCYLQPDGGWGWSNAGLIVDGDESLIVDTLFDETLTEEMLESMKKAEPLGMKNIRPFDKQSFQRRSLQWQQLCRHKRNHL